MNSPNGEVDRGRHAVAAPLEDERPDRVPTGADIRNSERRSETTSVHVGDRGESHGRRSIDDRLRVGDCPLRNERVPPNLRMR